MKKNHSMRDRDERLALLDKWTSRWEERIIGGEAVRVRILLSPLQARERGMDVSDFFRSYPGGDNPHRLLGYSKKGQDDAKRRKKQSAQ